MSVEGLGVVQPVSDVPSVPVEIEHRGGIGDEGGGLLDEVCHDPRGRKQVAVKVVKLPQRPKYITVEALYCGHLGDLVKCTVQKCPHFRGKFP